MYVADGIKINSQIKMTVYHSSITARKGRYNKLPGKIVGEFGIKTKDRQEIKLYFGVSPYRKEVKTVLEQSEREGKLSPYTQSLFNSCFKGW